MEFSKKDIKQKVKSILENKFHFDSIIWLNSNEFKSKNSEENLFLICGDKQEFKNSINFWVKSFEKTVQILEQYEGELDYLEWFEINSIQTDKEEFKVFWKWLTKQTTWKIDHIKSPTKIYKQQMDGIEESFILENKEKFMLVYWFTTA